MTGVQTWLCQAVKRSSASRVRRDCSRIAAWSRLSAATSSPVWKFLPSPVFTMTRTAGSSSSSRHASSSSLIIRASRALPTSGRSNISHPTGPRRSTMSRSYTSAAPVLRRPLLPERREALAEVLAARRQLQRERLVAELRRRASVVAPGVEQPLGQARARRSGPLASVRDELVGRARRARRAGTAPVDRCPTRRPRRRRRARPSRSISRARTSPTRRGSSQVAPLSGVKPRSANGSQKRASSAATVKSAASARWRPMPAAQPAHRADHRDLHVEQRAGSAGGPATAAGAGCCPTRGLRVAAGALRATMSAPPQKCSPAPASRMTRTASSRPARSTASIEPRTSSRRRSRCACRARSSAQRQHPGVERDVEARRPTRRSLIGVRTRRRSRRARPARSRAPPGGSGRRTGPCSRLGSRIVACPGS